MHIYSDERNAGKIRVIVVDDERLAREELTRFLSEDQEIDVVGQASSGEEALREIESKTPDAVFLDIEMPGLDGLGVASRLSQWEKPPLIVFATAFHEYAIDAFEAQAIGYVLKPYDAEKLNKALDRVKELVREKSPSKEKLVSLEDYLIKKGKIKKLVGHERNKKDRIVIDPKDVLYFHAQYSEVIAALADRELIVNSTLKEILTSMDPSQYAQTHKAYVVNLDKVEKVSPMFSGNFEIHLKGQDQTKVPLSRRYAKQIKTLLGNW